LKNLSNNTSKYDQDSYQNVDNSDDKEITNLSNDETNKSLIKLKKEIELLEYKNQY